MVAAFSPVRIHSMTRLMRVSGPSGSSWLRPRLLAVALTFLATDSICNQDAADNEAAKQREAVPLNLGKILVRPMGLAGPAPYFPAEAFILTARLPGPVAMRELESSRAGPIVASSIYKPSEVMARRSHFPRLFHFRLAPRFYRIIVLKSD